MTPRDTAWPPPWLASPQPASTEPPDPADDDENLDCEHREIQEFPTFDGYLNRQCAKCGEWFTCRKASVSHPPAASPGPGRTAAAASMARG